MPRPRGECHLCGEVSELTFEHVPPASAFNGRKVILPPVEEILALKDLDDLPSLRGRQQQLGQGGFTLCSSCNNQTGSWYVPAYTSWAYQAARFVTAAQVSLALAYPYHLFPGRVLKQVACMFFSCNPAGFQKRHPDLVRYVLNRDAKYLPEKLRFYVAYVRHGRSRRSSVAGLADISGASGPPKIFSEISHFPFAYILSLDGQPPVHEMLDITPFQHYGFDHFASMHLRIPQVDIYTPFPGDFRPREQVLRESGDA